MFSSCNFVAHQFRSLSPFLSAQEIFPVCVDVCDLSGAHIHLAVLCNGKCAVYMR